MTDNSIFEPFPKIPRLKRECVVTEKIDGTNAQIIITESGELFAGSRNRLITVGDDNYGFARWVQDNREELLKLGQGRHFGEWWGAGIQRGYGLEKGDRRFSLFNADRWADESTRPSCCGVVPILYRGVFNSNQIDDCITALNAGSVAAPGFMHPEGVIVWLSAARSYFKIMCKNDETPKGIAA